MLFSSTIPSRLSSRGSAILDQRHKNRHDQMSALDIIANSRIVAIVRLDDLSSAKHITDALTAGGIRAIEFTLTNDDAVRTISEIARLVDDSVTIGAGSVISGAQVRAVADAGAQFVVSPVCKREVIDACLALELPTMPGAFTPSEIQQAWEWGASVVKVFPANHLGKRYIRDVMAPLPHLRLMPTGGINADNLRDFLDMGAFALGVGSALINNEAIATRNWKRLESDARRYVERLP